MRYKVGITTIICALLSTGGCAIPARARLVRIVVDPPDAKIILRTRTMKPLFAHFVFKTGYRQYEIDSGKLHGNRIFLYREKDEELIIYLACDYDAIVSRYEFEEVDTYWDHAIIFVQWADGLTSFSRQLSPDIPESIIFKRSDTVAMIRQMRADRHAPPARETR